MRRQSACLSCVVVLLSLIPGTSFCEPPRQTASVGSGSTEADLLIPLSTLGLIKGVSQSAPLGVGALANYAKLKDQPFDANASLSHSWLRNNVDSYDKATDRAYKGSLSELIEGRGDGTPGLRKWLTDPGNIAWWDKTILNQVGAGSYARLVALKTAFAPGTESYRAIFGGSRRYDPKRNVMILNGSERPGVKTVEMLVRFPANASAEEQFATLAKFGAAVRRQMFNFYVAYQKGAISQKQVGAFNEALQWAGGSAVTNLEGAEPARLLRYLNGLNLMAITLGQLGFKVETVQWIGPQC